jgi:tyrosyl-tRNA synthetase
MIGDPSGKSAERNLLDENSLKENIGSMQANLSQISNNIFEFLLKNPENYDLEIERWCKLKENLEIVDNKKFYDQMGALEFLRDIGKHFRVSTLLAKDSVASRINSQAGISYTEFSYQLLQAYDFSELYKYNVS